MCRWKIMVGVVKYKKRKEGNKAKLPDLRE